MSDIEKQAHAIILRAKSQAARILTEAQRIGEESKKEAVEAGRLEGEASGQAAGLEQGRLAGEATALAEQRGTLSQLVQTMTAMLTELDSSRAALESAATTGVLQLAVAIARKVTRRAALSDDSIVTATLADAVQKTVRAADIRVAINPAEKSTLEAALPRLQMTIPSLKHIELVEDESIARGGCQIGTATGGIVDAGLDVQIDRLAAELLPE